MRLFSRKLSLLALGLVALLGVTRFTSAASVAVTLNDGRVRTVNAPPAFSISNTTVTSPYGTDVETTPGGGLLITFSPTQSFMASASNLNGIQNQTNDGHLVFTLTFEKPILLMAIITEGGNWNTAGTGMAGVTVGGCVTALDNILGPSIQSNDPLVNFNDDHTWTAENVLGPFNQEYRSYRFSIDNVLSADAPVGAGLNSAMITKTSFSIYIPPPIGGGDAPATPLPLASLGGAGLGTLALALRKKLLRQ